MDVQQQNQLFRPDLKFWQKIVLFHPHKKDTFLILKRSMTDTSRPGKWDFPGGGVMFGEEHLEALRREAREEVALEFNHPHAVFVWTYVKESLYNLFIGYKGTALSDTVTLSEEHDEYRWVTKEEFLQVESADYLIQLIHEVFATS